MSGHVVAPPAFELDTSQSGLELARKWIATRTPGGFVDRIAARPIEVDRGFMRMVCDIDAGHSNFVGLVHGGLSSALVDLVCGGAAMTLLQPGQFLLSTDLHMRFLNGAPISCQHLYAEGRASFSDDRKVVSEARISLEDRTVVALGTALIAIRSRG
ncbi:MULTISPECIES: PaaI family thioesterase, partial [unclassified Brevundimonas]|uniref:PaaI family thioesterase n=1 Tax=unclassified Brevundimonas TaxID=2622653 RepID=UPI0025BA303B